jgi:hypothetical protein
VGNKPKNNSERRKQATKARKLSITEAFGKFPETCVN